MQRISVDLPEPEGPQMTMRSPLRTVRLISFNTWNCPNHLCTAAISIMTSSEIRMAGSSATAPFDIGGLPSALVAGVQPAFQILAVSRHPEADHEEHEAGEEEALPAQPGPGGVARRRLDDPEQLEQPDDQHHAGRRSHAPHGGAAAREGQGQG